MFQVFLLKYDLHTIDNNKIRSTSKLITRGTFAATNGSPVVRSQRFADRKEEVFTPRIFSFVLTAAHRVSTSDILRFS